MLASPERNPRILSAAEARERFDEILGRVRKEKKRFLIEDEGEPQAVVMSIEDYVNTIAPPPDWLEAAWRAAEEHGTDRISIDEIDREIAAVRRERGAREEGAA